MSLRLGDIAPDFNAKTSIGDIRFHEYLGDSWVFYFHILQISLQYVPQS
jgi:alkyl hydroperoxide reductase subunit AhpC